jgi:hypothetical protein
MLNLAGHGVNRASELLTLEGTYSYVRGIGIPLDLRFVGGCLLTGLLLCLLQLVMSQPKGAHRLPVQTFTLTRAA